MHDKVFFGINCLALYCIDQTLETHTGRCERGILSRLQTVETLVPRLLRVAFESTAAVSAQRLKEDFFTLERARLIACYLKVMSYAET
jgi:hypothetical protein